MDLGIVLTILVGLLAVWLALLLLLWLFRPRNVPLREALRIVPDPLRLVRSLSLNREAPLSVRLALIQCLRSIARSTLPRRLRAAREAPAGHYDGRVRATRNATSTISASSARRGQSSGRRSWSSGQQDGRHSLAAVAFGSSVALAHHLEQGATPQCAPRPLRWLIAWSVAARDQALLSARSAQGENRVVALPTTAGLSHRSRWT